MASGEIELTFHNGAFFVSLPFEKRLVAKSAGFYWDDFLKVWYTKNVGVASRLKDYANESARRQFDQALLKFERWYKGISHPKNLKPYNFQMIAADWALSRNRSYLALDAGLGKTIVAALIHNALSVAGVATAYICPPFLLENTAREFAKWSPSTRVSRITDEDFQGARLLLVPDSILARDDTKAKIELWGSLFEPSTRMLIVDEAHRFKSPNAKRTKALFRNIAPMFDKVVHMSGTPMPSRPIELFSVLSHHAGELIGFRNYIQFGKDFCAGKETVFGWDMTGVSNFKELIEPVRLKYKPGVDPFLPENDKRFMLRINKADVLDELPEKTESLVIIDDKLPKKLEKLEKKLLESMRPADMVDVIGDEHLSTYRKELGLEKARSAARFVREVLEDSGEAVILFAIHKEAIAFLETALKQYKPLIITGSVDKDERARRAIEFQGNPERRLIILNIAAGGVGFNLYKASRVIFAEFDWVPGNNEQAIARAHRIGQKSHVIAQYLVYRDSLDALILDTVLNKQRTIQKI
jgi:SWI/SNF-related matrix-associated actin-dependent regulator 1 of chromatin subfamily A